MIKTRERFSSQLTDDPTQLMREAERKIDKAKTRAKKLTPLCPDGSGEIGIFDQEASDFLGGLMVYKTSSNKRFHWVDIVQKGKVFKPNRFDFM